MHLIKERLNTEEIRRLNAHSVSSPFILPLTQLPTEITPLLQITLIKTNNEARSLYFNVVSDHDNNETVTVEGGGVNATIIQADLVATNGYVHIIDHVLGSPVTTMLQKLRTDPMLK